MNVALLFLYKISKGSNFFRNFKRHHPNRSLCNQLDKLVDLKCKLVKSKVYSQFVVDCINKGVYTKHLRDRMIKVHLKPSKEACERFLQTENEDVLHKITWLSQKIRDLRHCVNDLSIIEFCRFMKFSTSVLQRTRASEERKFQGIIASVVPCYDNTDLDKHIVNLSSYTLSIVEKQALRWGLDFCVPPSDVKRIPVEAEIESAFQQICDLKPTNADEVSSFKNSLVHMSNLYRRMPIEKGGLQQEHILALKKLKKMNNLVIIRPDKGSGCVLLDRSSYVSKMESILSDSSKFVLDAKQTDNTKKLETCISQLLTTLVDQGVISNQERFRLLSSGHNVPRLYGLPKTHKEQCPLRPILSMCGSPVHKTAAWLTKLISPVKDYFQKYSVKDSFEFVKCLRDYDVNNCKMVSFDIKSLFTSVPLRETIDIIISTIRDNNLDVGGINLETLRSLLELCTHDMQFVFDGQFYRQIDGVSMGSCLGPIFAEIFMSYLESRVSSQIDSVCKFFIRYVDDCFALLNSDLSEQQLLDTLNSMHPSIKYTVEVECNRSIPFLDVKCVRLSDGSVRTSIFRKNTWTSLKTNFHSFVPRSYKINVIRNLVVRAKRLCSPECLEEELIFIKKALLRNGYPPILVDNYMNVREEDKPIGPEKKAIYLKLPFIGDKAASFVRRVTRQLFSLYPAAKPKLLFSTSRIPIASPKDKIPVLSQSNVIYSFECTCGCRYLGRTGRRLEERIREHVPKWLEKTTKCPPRSTRIPTSAITRHLQVCTSCPSTARSRFKVVYRSEYDSVLRILEALSIHHLSPDLCVQKEHVMSLQLPW